MKPVFVGEAPGPGNDPDKHRPLFPYPANSAGDRLRKMCGMSVTEYLRAACRINLFPECPDAWVRVLAQRRAMMLRKSGLLEGRDVVCVGRKVWDAFYPGCPDTPPHVLVHSGNGLHRIGWMYHPSGPNRQYNDPDVLRRSQEFLSIVLAGERP